MTYTLPGIPSDLMTNNIESERRLKTSTDFSGVVDVETGSFKVISYAHSELHSGDHYMYRGYHSLAKNGYVDHLITTPDSTRYAHLTVLVEAINSSILVEMYEGSIYSDAGTAGNVRNRNRNYTDNNTTYVYETPTITSYGSLLASSFFGAGKNSGGGGTRDTEEILLKRNTNYVIRVIEQNIQETTCNFVFDWYEHTSG